MGRSKSEIDWEVVDRYLKYQCAGTEIAGLLGIAPITLYRACEREFKVNFDAYSAQKKSEGKELLRAKQFETAMSGNVSMQIWLGKQYLGQRDKSETDHNITDNTITGINYIVPNDPNAKADI